MNWLDVIQEIARRNQLQQYAVCRLWRMMSQLFQTTAASLHCSVGEFFIAPWESVGRVYLTQAHANHTREGSSHFLTSKEGRLMLQVRPGTNAKVDGIDYGDLVDVNGVRVSSLPAGHILCPLQIRVESVGEVGGVLGGSYIS